VRRLCPGGRATLGQRPSGSGRPPGEHGLKIKRGDLEFETDRFILRKGETITLRVELLSGKIQVVQGDRVLGKKLLPRARPTRPMWVQLFNGKDLTGWKQHPDSTGKWSVEEGMIVGRGINQSHLFTERGDYENFHIRIEAKINADGNSGVCFRTNYFGRGQLKGNGYEANIERDKAPGWQTGSLMHITPKGEVRTRFIKPDQWFEMEVIAVGNRITIKVNGKTTVDLTDPGYTYKRGYLALQQLGALTEVRFRKIEIKEFSPEAAAGWQDLFNGKDLSGWKVEGKDGWSVQDGVLTADGSGVGYLMTEKDYTDYELELDYRISPRGNSGLGLQMNGSRVEFRNIRLRVLGGGG
jgi:3-keto-disaccharide hydrolase